MDHKLPTDNGPEVIKMKQAASLALVFAAIGTTISAMNDMFGWMVFGLVLSLVSIMLIGYTPDLGD